MLAKILKISVALMAVLVGISSICLAKAASIAEKEENFDNQ